MKNWIWGLMLAVALLAGLFLAVFKILVPATARAFIPLGWQQVPLGEKRSRVHEYLGRPQETGTGPRDRWKRRLGNRKHYLLDIRYNADSIARSYMLVYEVNLFGYNSRTVLVRETAD